MFSRTLVATSPHEQLLRRFRSTHTAHYAANQPLPQPQDNEVNASEAIDTVSCASMYPSSDLTCLSWSSYMRRRG